MKDLLVHVNVSEHCRARFEVAAPLVRSFDAHLTGLYTSAVGDVPFFMEEEISSRVEPARRAWWLQMRDKAKAEFDGFWREAGIAVDWLEIDEDVGAMVPYHARYADLTIIGQIDPEELLPRPEYEVPERVVLESGRPVLIVPYAGTFATVGQRILVAWNGSAPSARAVNDAMPFLRRAKQVTILTLDADRLRTGKDARPSAHLAAHLARHGLKAEARELATDDVGVDEMILSQAADQGADLIVMGAYGHPRAREIILGGATRGLFQHMTVPILMSH